MDNRAKEPDHRKHRKHLPHLADGGVLGADEDQGADLEQKRQSVHDIAVRVRRLRLRLHVVPVGAIADVGAIAHGVACAQRGNAGARWAEWCW